MPSSSSNSMHTRILTPVIFLVVIWILMSSVTTFYLFWLDRSRQRIRTENVVSMRSAESIQTLVWTLAAVLPQDENSQGEFRTQLSTLEPQVEEHLDKLKKSASAEEERVLLLALEKQIAEFLGILHGNYTMPIDAKLSSQTPVDAIVIRTNALEVARQIGESASEVYAINRSLADRENARQQTFGRFVSGVRLTILVAGPSIGVFLGWRLARVLHQSISRIAVTLREAGSSVDSEVGTIAIKASGNFEDVQQQAEQVVERMRQVSTELQIARGEVLRSERLAAVGELAAGVAHEIRNPLTSIKLLLQHAIRQAAGPRLDETKINLILDEIDRMELIIQGLLDFSRPPRLNPVRHDVRDTLQRALNLVEARAHQQRIQIVVQAGETPLTVDGDTEKLHQVLVNLLINAIEEMNEGGRLTIDAKLVADSMRPDTSDSNLSAVRTERKAVQIVIRDTGHGIPAELLPRLFEPFATTKERGTGLGLAVSRRIVQEHSGRIYARNRPDGGAEFLFEIPAAG